MSGATVGRLQGDCVVLVQALRACAFAVFLTWRVFVVVYISLVFVGSCCGCLVGRTPARSKYNMRTSTGVRCLHPELPP